jgi:adenosine deaminase
METRSIIKHLLCDDDSLSSYFLGQLVSFEAVKLRMFLLERIGNRFIPDHYYRLSQEKSFNEIDSLSGVLIKGLLKIAEEHLELRRNRIHVMQEKQNDWQELITRIPPLVLQAVFLHKHKPLTGENTSAVQVYFRDVILPNAKYTALPYPFIPQLEMYIEEKNGLHDLHMHLNGSTETDLAWQDFLKTPDKIYKELQDGFRNNLVKEQFEQESHLTDPIKFRDLLLIARRIRNYMFIMLYPETLSKKDLSKIKSKDKLTSESFSNESIERLAKIESFDKLLEAIVYVDSPFFDGLHNPFLDLLANKEITDTYPMAVECLMYVKIFQYLSYTPKESVASLFHFYLLILGLANRLLVQQTHQYGFEQFQKHTVNRLREESEGAYANRFLQLHGNELRNIRFLEGRFSPKENEPKNLLLLQDIQSGWKNLLKVQKNVFPLKEEPKLMLIAHFIKVKEKEKDSNIRHKDLRKSVWQKASVLGYLKERNSKYIQEVTGIDAAASEFDAQPEVFAPAFRLLRRRGFEHFTYHAGEDFYHIISGLRAIYESIEFLDMQHGDRIGHAVASGVDAQVWIDNVGKYILIRRGEHLDNLIFVYHLIIKEKIGSLQSYLPQLALEISELCFKIYQEFYPVEVLVEAWLLRKYCPMLLLSGKKEFAETYSVYCDEEWYEIEKQLNDRKDMNLIKVIEKYHFSESRIRYDEIIELEALELFKIAAIKELQQTILKHMHKKEVVIETLPTSNVRIGQHHSFDTYHLWNWVKWEEEGHSIPPIVVGTDDTGIFATNIYNEYANIYCHLTCQCRMVHHDAMSLIEKLDKNASIYRFQ